MRVECPVRQDRETFRLPMIASALDPHFHNIQLTHMPVQWRPKYEHTYGTRAYVQAHYNVHCLWNAQLTGMSSPKQSGTSLPELKIF